MSRIKLLSIVVLASLLLGISTFQLLSHRFSSKQQTPPAEQEAKLPTPINVERQSSSPAALPWDTDQDFWKTIRTHQTPVLLASYQAVLRDPLPGEAHNIAQAARILRGTVVKPGEIFSQNRTVGPYTRERGFQEGPMYAGNRITTTIGGGVCKIASLLYNVATLAHLKIIERHPHSLTVPYVPPGQDATVNYGAKDFRFQNNTGAPIVIWSEFRDNALYMALYGCYQPPVITWHHKVLDRTETWTEYHNNSTLPPGKERVVMPGQEGIRVRSWLTVTWPDGQVETHDLGVDSYAASPRIVERGPRS